MIGHTIYVVDEGDSQGRMRWYTSINDVYYLTMPPDAIAGAVQSISSGLVFRVNSWQSIRFTSPTPATNSSVKTITVVFEDAIVQLPVPDYIADLVPDNLTETDIEMILNAISWILDITQFVGII